MGLEQPIRLQRIFRFASAVLAIATACATADVAANGTCNSRGDCISFSPAAPTSAERTSLAIAIYSYIPADACIHRVEATVSDFSIQLNAAYEHCYDIFFLRPPTFLYPVLEPLRPGTYAVTLKVLPAPNYIPIDPPIEDLTLTASLVVRDSGLPVSMNRQGLWWASPAGSEAGWGMNLAHQGDVIFVTWFSYDQTGKAWWLSATMQKTDSNEYSGSLYETRGPPFNAAPFVPQDVIAKQAGLAALTFGDSDNGVFRYTIAGIEYSKAITRQKFGPQPNCTFGAEDDLTLATNYQDLWWAAPPGIESGWGIDLAHQGDTIFATWFTYDTDGSPLWLSATAQKAGPGSYSGTLYRTSGPSFDAIPFDTAQIAYSIVGTLGLEFIDGNSAILKSTVNGVSQAKAITRQVFRLPGTVCQ